MRTTSPTTLRRFAAATALAAAGVVGLAGVAAADTPEVEPPVIIVAGPEPTIPHPDPLPEDLPLADPCGQLPQGCEVPEPDPEPPVVPDLPLADPCGQLPEGCEQPDPDPDFDGADDFTDDPCNHLSHGCGEDPDIDDFENPTENPDDGGEDPGEDPEGEDPAPEPKGDDGGVSSSDRSALPHTGASIAGITGLGAALVAGGLAARRAARR